MLAFTIDLGEFRDPETRLAVLEDLAREFTSRPVAEWGFARDRLERASQSLGVELPKWLVRWYMTVGQVREQTRWQNRLRSPEELAICDEVLLFCDENQSCTRWGVQLSDLPHSDPPVVLDCGDELGAARPVWRREADSVSSFSLSLAFSELALSGDCFGTITAAGTDVLRRTLRELPVQPLRWPQVTQTSLFLADADLIILVQGECLSVAAKRLDARDYVSRLAGVANVEWE